jgi:signal transduction histidine kinase
MRPSFRIRLFLLLAAIVCLVGLVAGLARRTWAQAVAVRDHVRVVQGESVQLEEKIRVAVQSLDNDLLRLSLAHDPAQANEFERDVVALQQWLQQQSAVPHTSEEVQTLGRFSRELNDYLAVARRIVAAEASAQATLAADAADAVEALHAELAQHSETLLGLGFTLATAHNDTLDSVLAGADAAVARIEWSTFAALGLLLGVGAGVAWLVYRDFISPLQRTLQEHRLQLERQEKLASLGVLSAGIAHEIRNPLTAVKARLFTLRKAVHDDPSAAEDVSVINDEVDRLERIVRDFLRFARPPEPTPVPVDPVALLRHVRNLVGPQWAPKGITLELDETPAPAVCADRDQIEQVLLNLVQNAAEAMPQGGTIRLRAAACTGTDHGRTLLEVADTGPGIPPDVKARLFDPFFSTKGNGTGLGLALSARIVEKHRGLIRFTTGAGVGTTFVILLPLATS